MSAKISYQSQINQLSLILLIDLLLLVLENIKQQMVATAIYFVCMPLKKVKICTAYIRMSTSYRREQYSVCS